MPTIFDPKDLSMTRQNNVAYTILANSSMIGSDALHIERVTLEAGSHTPPADAIPGEQFIYVVRGAGQAQIGEATYPLEHESILWIESGDAYSLKAGAEELEVLICRAPAGE